MQVTIVNACLRDGSGGSPTAVLEAASLTDLERCQVPKLMGTSHAVFVSTDEDFDRPLASLRFFTAAGELPGCGHGTVAALAFDIANRLVLLTNDFLLHKAPEELWELIDGM